MATKDKSTESTLLANEGLFAMAAGSGGGGSGNNGIGGGGGSPGGGNPGGGGGNGGGNGNGNGGKPGGESVGNNLSFPAIFFGDGAPTLRGTMGDFLFTVPTYLTDSDYVYFAQGVAENTWQAGNYTTAEDIVVDYVDIGDALESAPIKAGNNVRLELTMYEELDSPLTAFAMTVLGGAKGEGKPAVKGPTESQGARLHEDLWDGTSYDSTTDTPPDPDTTTYESDFASVYAANAAVGENDAVESYMSMTVQRVTGVAAESDLSKLHWDGAQWIVQAGDPGVTVGENLANTAFGPELNIAGKYIMGASGKPFKFTSDGDYLITFALEDGRPVSFDTHTQVANDFNPEMLGFQPGAAEGRETWVVADPNGGTDDTHNGLLVMLVGVPSSPDEGGGEG